MYNLESYYYGIFFNDDFKNFFGGIISLVRRLWGDMISLVSYIISAKNFNKNEFALLISELGDAPNYKRRCIHGDGDIFRELGLGDSLGSFDDIYHVENNISSIKQNFNEIINILYDKKSIRKTIYPYPEVNVINITRDNDIHIPIVYSKVLNKINTLNNKIHMKLNFIINMTKIIILYIFH